MKTRVHAVVLLVLVISGSDFARARAGERGPDQSPRENAVEVARGESFVSLMTQITGEPILVIKYPWKRHARPSVEVRVLDEEEVDNPLIRPLFFVHDMMKGEVTSAVYHCQDRSDEVSQTASFTRDYMEGKIDFHIFGVRNTLGRPSACVACRVVIPKRVPETRAAFCLLDAWAIDERMLCLELPAEYFSRPSKIRVWLLRDKDIVWTAVIPWPGVPE